MKVKKVLSLLLAALMLLSFAACSGNSGKTVAELNRIFEDGSLKQYYLNNPETFMAIAQKEISMSEADAQDFLANPESWQVYSLEISVSNNGKEPFSYIGFKEADTEQEGFYFSTCPINGELSLPAGIENEFYPATIVINTSKVSTEEMYSAVAGLEIVLLGYPTPEDDNEVIDPSDYTEIKVKNNITAPEDDKDNADKEIVAKRSSIADGSAYLDLYRNNELIFANEAKLYGMDSETAVQVTNKEGKWQCYVFYIAVENKTDTDLTVYRILPENNGANGVWLNSVSQYGEFSMASGMTDEIPVTILVNPDALGGKTVEQVIAEMTIELEYSKGTLMDANGNESIQIKKIATVN
ncbi:MAG: hypothetical protein IKK49_02250 [Clostridia bacterium]|nr:hypothetical protein [Clostridia bacterium]